MCMLWPVSLFKWAVIGYLIFKVVNFQSSRILPQVLGRKGSFLQVDIEAAHSQICKALEGARVLVIGAAGSIGGAFVRELIGYPMRSLHLIDISENNLVELVRELRSGSSFLPEDFATYAIDFGQLEMKALLWSEKYDYVMNFSALKHVRSERDPFTLMRLLDVNVLANSRLLNWSRETGQNHRRVFGVSSDKAVRSGNLMGASKAFMERLFLSKADQIPFSSARFANVAFSDGSLLHGFRQRIDKRQPISAPNDVRRYFISPQEAGQLCLLGCFVCNNREIVYPLFKPEEDMMTFSSIALTFLKECGLKSLECSSEEEAKAIASEIGDSPREWPCFFSGSDTSGEKEFEEFYDPSEERDEERFQTVGVIKSPVFHGSDQVQEGIENLMALRASGQWSKDEVVSILEQAVPEMAHVVSDKSLDQKM